MSTLALAVSPAKVRPRVAWRVFLALAGSWLVAGLAQLEIKLPFTPVPITGQTLGVLLVGASLGTGLGVISMALYLLQGGIGFPFFSGGDSGVEFLKLSSATGGYLFGFVLAAAAVGWLSECGWDRTLRSLRRHPVAHASARRVPGACPRTRPRAVRDRRHVEATARGRAAPGRMAPREEVGLMRERVGYLVFGHSASRSSAWRSPPPGVSRRVIVD